MGNEGEYKVEDLVGCEVETVEGEKLGLMVDVLATGANDVYVVGEGEKEVLIPALKDVVLSVDIENKRIVVKLPKGLRDPLKPSRVPGNPPS